MKKIFTLFLLFAISAIFAKELQYIYIGNGTTIKFHKSQKHEGYFSLEIFNFNIKKILQNSKEKDIIVKKTKNPIFFKKMSEVFFPHSENEGVFSLSGLNIKWNRYLYLFPFGKNTQQSENNNKIQNISCEFIKQNDIFYIKSISFKEIDLNKNDIKKSRGLYQQSLIQEGNPFFMGWNSRVSCVL